MTTFKRLCLLLCLALIAGPVWAEPSALQVYKELKQARSAFDGAWGLMLSGNSSPELSAAASRKLNESSDLKSLEVRLKSMADAEDSVAMFLWGLYRANTGEADGKVEAAHYYKRAANRGMPEGAFYLAEQYKTGGAGTTSKLAAIEWFYKAGTLYAKHGEREQALASLEEMQALDKSHSLSKKLAKQLGAQ